MAEVIRNPTDHEAEHVETYPVLYWLVLTLYGAGFIIGALFFPELGYWLLATALLLLAVMSKAPGAGKKAGVLVFGVATIKPWNYPVPLLPGMNMPTMPEYPAQWQFPGDPEQVFHGHDNEPLPPGMVRPLRLITGKPQEDYDNALLNIQMSTKVTGTARPRIRDFFDFWFRHAGESADAKLKEAFRQGNDTWLRAVKREWSTRPVGKIIDEINAIEEEVRGALDTDVNTRGLDIYEVTLLPPDLDHAMSAELSGVGEAKARRVQTETSAEADKFARERDAEAAAYELKQREDAETDAIENRGRKLGMQPRELMAFEEAPKILGDKAKLIFGADGITQTILAVGAAIEKVRKDESDTQT